MKVTLQQPPKIALMARLTALPAIMARLTNGTNGQVRRPVGMQVALNGSANLIV